ncbi:hypothetical protein NUH30_03540 [Leptospira sp. 85282-16]|nr:hypothetical protein [Leptospira sp. 85282-16]
MGKTLLEMAGQKALFKIRKHRGSSFMRSDLGKYYNTHNPLNYLGATWAFMNYAAGKLMQRDTKLKKVNGGYVVQGGPLATTGITIGQFAVTAGADEESLRHETAHLQQYREWGANKYMCNLGSSPFRRGEAVGENEADLRAGTFAYDVNKDNKRSSLILRYINISSQSSDGQNTLIIMIYMDYIP